MRIAIAGATGLIGRQLVELGTQHGHDIVPLSRATGFDLTAASVVAPLTEVLDGADAVIDVTQGSDFDDAALEAFFVTVAEHLATAAREAGVERTVVLSIVGIERAPEYGYYAAKIAQEQAYREASPNVQILRATQFHEFPEQNIEWYTQDGIASIMDAQLQPVDSAEVAAALLEMATGAHRGDLQIAGPQVESLVALAQHVVAGERLDISIEAQQPPAGMDTGMLPHVDDSVEVRGQSWSDWYATRH